MNSALRVLITAAGIMALSFWGGVSAVGAEPAAFNCAGITEVPGGATYASDRNGNAILITSNGTVIRCDGSGTYPDLATADANAGRSGRASSSAFASSFVGPDGSGHWTMVQSAFFPGTNQDLVGYLGSDADQTIIFWRSSPGGPIETWTSDATLVP